MLFITICKWTPLKCEISSSALSFFFKKVCVKPRTCANQPFVMSHEGAPIAHCCLTQAVKNITVQVCMRLVKHGAMFSEIWMSTCFLPARRIFWKQSLDDGNRRDRDLLTQWRQEQEILWFEQVKICSHFIPFILQLCNWNDRIQTSLFLLAPLFPPKIEQAGKLKVRWN